MFLTNFSASIGGAVIDNHIIHRIGKSGGDFGQPGHHTFDVCFFIVAGNDYKNPQGVTSRLHQK